MAPHGFDACDLPFISHPYAPSLCGLPCVPNHYIDTAALDVVGPQNGPALYVLPERKHGPKAGNWFESEVDPMVQRARATKQEIREKYYSPIVDRAKHTERVDALPEAVIEAGWAPSPSDSSLVLATEPDLEGCSCYPLNLSLQGDCKHGRQPKQSYSVGYNNIGNRHAGHINGKDVCREGKNTEPVDQTISRQFSYSERGLALQYEPTILSTTRSYGRVLKPPNPTSHTSFASTSLSHPQALPNASLHSQPFVNAQFVAGSSDGAVQQIYSPLSSSHTVVPSWALPDSRQASYGSAGTSSHQRYFGLAELKDQPIPDYNTNAALLASTQAGPKSTSSAKFASVPRYRRGGRKPSNNVCSECFRSFDRPSLLKNHMYSHTGVKAYKCQYCDSDITTGSNLQRHYNTAKCRNRRADI